MSLALKAMLALAVFWLVVGLLVRIVPVVRRGRVVVLDRPKPCSMREAQRALIGSYVPVSRLRSSSTMTMESTCGPT